MSAPIQETLLTNCYRALAAGDIPTAHEIASREAIRCEQMNDLKQAGIWRRSLAETLSRRGLYAEGAKEAARSADMQPDPYERAIALHVFATEQLFESKCDTALVALVQAEEIGRSFPKADYLKGRWGGVRALAFCLTGDLDRAIAEWMTAANLFREGGHWRDAASVLNSVGFELAKQGQLEKAEDNLLTSLELITEQPHVHTKASICDSVGYLYTLMERYDDAERYLNESARIFQKIPDKSQLVGTLLHLSELRERQRNWREARSQAERALKLAGETKLEHLCSDARNRFLSIEAIYPLNGNRSTCFHGLIYASQRMRSLIAQLKLIAAIDVGVLITGETGTGKDLVAQAVHEESKRRTGPFIPFNCSALSRELVESRLFGHRRGAFTGAYSDEQGLIRAAAGGTVFLDEIGDLTLEAQGALLRFLDSGEIQPIGVARPVKTDVRVITATNRDLRAVVEAGRFRRDLYYRLNIATLFVPPLWQRPEDVKELARHFARSYSKEFNKPEPVFSREEMARLLDYDWPGNVRELQNHIKRRVLWGAVEIEIDGNLGAPSSRVLRMTGTHASCEPSATGQRSGTDSSWRSLSKSEKYARLIEALECNRGNVTKTARQLGLSRRTVERLRRTNIE